MEEIITVGDGLWLVVSNVSLEFDGLFTLRDAVGGETLIDRAEIPNLIEALQKVADRGKTE